RARARSTRIPHSHFRTRTEDSLRPRVDMVAIEGQSLAETAAVAAPAPAGLPKEARGLLHELAAEWADVADCRALEVVPLKGAMTNEVYQVRWLTGGGEEKGEGEYRKVLMRVYGEGVEVFFDREDEVRTFECMSRHGHGPRLLGRFPTGRVEEFIHARVRLPSNPSLYCFFFFCSSRSVSWPVRSILPSSPRAALVSHALRSFQRKRPPLFARLSTFPDSFPKGNFIYAFWLHLEG
uniref:Choline kinase N-terminal domain-containing protein n=1 Tax=Aegilops tauschii subsp. strangulata TaxID=200361 RepID=A0A452ZNS4_AEGTS